MFFRFFRFLTALTTTVTPSCTREGDAYRPEECFPTYNVDLSETPDIANYSYFVFKSHIL